MRMKKLSIIPFILMYLVALPTWSETMEDLVKRDGIYYKKFTDEPFTGEVKDRADNGKFKNGQKEGFWVAYWNNGQLRQKGDFRGGKKDGFWISYHENGQLWNKGEWRNGSREGPWITYFDDGRLYFKGDYRKGDPEGPWITYYRDGRLNAKGS